MPIVDIKSLNLAELKALRTRIDKAIDRLDRKEKTQALNKLKAQAKSLGFTLDELIGVGGTKPSPKPAKKPSKKKAPLPPVYRDTENLENTWSGRGRRPAWIEKALSEGNVLDEFKITS